MSEARNGSEWSSSGDPGDDPVLTERLRLVDPAHADPNYWFRFRAWVLRGAAPELARRRLMTELTVGEVLTSWARTVIPTALLAAALAGMLLLRPDPAPLAAVSVDELLIGDVEGLSVPPALRGEEQGTAVIFAEETF